MYYDIMKPSFDFEDRLQSLKAAAYWVGVVLACAAGGAAIAYLPLLLWP